tara:strand:- start:46 stop:1803 length:1758 start_codon:yes stop_codon:yes gene_type:complete
MELKHKSKIKHMVSSSKPTEFFRYQPDGFKLHYGWSSMAQIDGGNFGLEYAHGAHDYGASKMYIVNTETDIWFINNGESSPPDIVRDRILKIKNEVGFSDNKTECFGQGSTKITSARIGANVGFYTMKTNQFDVYKVEYPEYFPLNSLHDKHWKLLNGKGDDVYVTRHEVTHDEYKSHFPSEIMDNIDFVPTWAMQVRKYGFQAHPIKPLWSKLQHHMDMTFVNDKFDYEFIDLTRERKPKMATGTQLYFPTYKRTDKQGYISNIQDLNPVVDENDKQLFFELPWYDSEGTLVRTDKFAVYHYHFLTEDFDMIEGKRFKDFIELNGSIFKAWKTKPSTVFNHFFDHTGKHVFSTDAHNTGVTGEKYNFSNMVFQLVEGEIPYNIIKLQGAGPEFIRPCNEFHRKYIDDNVQLQHKGFGKVENSKVNELYDVQVGNKKNKPIQGNITNSLLYIAQMSGVYSITYPLLLNGASHNLTDLTDQGELDWFIGADFKKTVLVEAMDKNLDLIHARQFKWQLDSFAKEVEIGILLIEGNPNTSGNRRKIKQLKKTIENRSLEALKEVWVVSFDDIINNKTESFVQLGFANS